MSRSFVTPALLALLLAACGMDANSLQVPVAGPAASTAASTFADGEYVAHQGTFYLVSGGMLWGIPDWETYRACTGGHLNSHRVVQSLPLHVYRTLPSVKQHPWMSGAGPVQASGTPVHQVSGCQRSPLPSVAAYESLYGSQDWSLITTVSHTVLSAVPFAEAHVDRFPVRMAGTLVKKASHPEVRWIVANGKALAVSDGNHLTSRCRTFAEIIEIPAAEFDALQVTGLLQPATDPCVTRPAEAFTWPLQPWSPLNGTGPANEHTYDFHRNFGVVTNVGVRSCRDTQRFQRRAVWNDSLKTNTWHLGGDMNCGTGSDDLGVPVHAVADGTVVYTGIPSGWGGVVMIRHETPWGSYVSGYFHVRWLPSGPPSGSVKRGQRIAEIGPTSKYSTAPHLHFELRSGTSTVLGSGVTHSQIAGGATDTGPQGQIDPIAFIAAHRY